MKRLPEWVTALRRNYYTNVFSRAWWNIVIFHTFFVIVMVCVFGVILHYTKTSIFLTVSSILETIAGGGNIDPQLLSKTSTEIDQLNFMILFAMILFSAVSGIIAAHITLIPTRDEFAQRKKFITAVAHELRTPLAVLRTSNEVALFDMSDKKAMEEVIQSNIEETKHMANILNNLIVFSRVGAAESLSFEGTNINELIENVIKKLSIFARTHHVELTHTANPVPSISANTTALEQVFYNIVKNAVIYSKKQGGTVTIETTANASYAIVTIEDTGIGIPQKNLKHIFEPFFRINPDDSQSSSGTGLGLTLVLEIIKLHKGIITVESTEEKGTKFTLQFPLRTLSLIQEHVAQNADSVSYSFEK